MNRAIFLLLVIFASGCATTGGVTSFKDGQDTANLHEKEKRLWYEAEGFDATIARSGQVYKNKTATRYLQRIMDRLYPEFKGKIHVQIYDSTQLNAFALPNGSIYFNVGLLARIQNEAQLATILSHEAAHFIEKHSFKSRVRAKNMSAFAMSGIPFASLAAISSISGFSKDLEREADAKGYQRLIKAGYNPKEAHKVFQYLADEVKALDIEEPFFFSSHPRLIERIEEYKRLASKHKGGGRIEKNQYNKIVRPIRLDVLRKDLGQDRYKSVILVMESNKTQGSYPAAAQYYLGEAYRRRDGKGDEKHALNAFQKAIKYAPKFAPTYKAMGMHYMKKRNKTKARYYFNRYLALAPKSAPDRDYVRSYMKSL